MDDGNQNSSITILLVICVAVIGIVGFGWFMLEGNTEDTPDVPATTPNIEAPADLVQSDVEPAPADVEPAIEETVRPAAAVDTDLRKARLAAEADILTDPVDRSALYYYGRVLDASPGHEVASAELDAVLGRLAVTATGLLRGENYDEAFRLAVQVSAIRPDHALVNEVQQTLDQISGDLVTQGMGMAEAGDSDGAAALLAQAEALPGRNRQYFQAVRESVDDLLKAQEDAQAEIEENERLAEARETRAWMEKVRGAIADGRLIAPTDDCAVSFLNERSVADEIEKQVRQELFSAVVASASAEIDSGQLEGAEVLLNAARDINTESEELDLLQQTLENTYIERESSRVLPIAELVRVNTVAAKYPRRAEERGISGWVEVAFTVMPSGETTEVTVANAQPEKVFDEPAVEAVEQWTFQPKEFRGQTITQRSMVRLVFKLE